ncbi:hypothetical protein [Streptobacillus notomytis]|uniref:hypothetical protein n=1 Tax=Streptobacillus notomytis TaxID=1712031 RepID=UPI0009369F8B|nr:hypothetical protein [Streptobacillus notomytis]
MINKIIKKEDIYEVMYNEFYSKNENLILNEEVVFEDILKYDKTKLKQLAKLKFKMKKFFYDIQFKKIFEIFNNDDFSKSNTFITNTLNKVEITKAVKEMDNYKSIIIHSDILVNLQNKLICDKGCPLNSSKVEDELKLKIILNNDITLNDNGEYISYVLENSIYDFNVDIVNEKKENRAVVNVRYGFDIVNNIIRIISKD